MADAPKTSKKTVRRIAKKTAEKAAGEMKKSVAKKKVLKPLTVKKTSVRKKLPAVVSNKSISGMIETNLVYASKARKKVFVDSEVMPADYGSTSVTLLSRDPHWVHAYWEISPASIECLRQNIGQAADHSAVVLRVYDVTLVDFNGSNANYYFDVDVGREANNWYVNFWSDNITCCADIGLRTSDGTFHTLSRSNFVTTPREYFSPRNEVIWMDVRPDEEEPRPYVYVGREPEMVGQGLSQKETGKSVVNGNARRFRMYLTEDDIRAYYSRLFPLLSRILSRRKKKKLSSPKAEELIDEEGDLVLECMEEMDLLGYDYFREMVLGSSEKMMLRGRYFQEILGGGASEQHISSWHASEQKKPGKDFFFELGTELIVYGRTEPDAVVFWGDRVIPLRPDGTFTLRMALPTDTHIPLDFKAISFRKELKRSIATAAGREKTEYQS
ncbi:MAG: DUF4912 domain-containing protein [Candidatus Omnitrophota bacterium]